MMSLEIEDNLLALDKYQTQAKNRGKSFKGPIGHALILDGFRYDDLPKLKRNAWLSLLPSLPTSDLSAEELRQVHTLYKQLDDLESLKESISVAKKKMDKEREMEKLVSALIQSGNPLAS